MSAIAQALRPVVRPLPARLGDYLALAKPRITFLVVFSAMAGYLVAVQGRVMAWHLFQTVLATALVAAGANAANQVLERERDARMRRTRSRPLPAGRMQEGEALGLSLMLSSSGFLWLLWAVNPLTAGLAILTWSSYLFIYTPLKVRTPLSTPAGAVPGALPAAAGWVAGRGSLGGEALAVFLIVYLWQMPHFFALAWMYREDYARAGFRMLPSVDPGGRATAACSALFSAALIPVSLVPVQQGWLGADYGIVAVVLAVGLVAMAVRFALRRTNRRARQLFAASLVYLPAVLALMMLTSVMSW